MFPPRASTEYVATASDTTWQPRKTARERERERERARERERERERTKRQRKREREQEERREREREKKGRERERSLSSVCSDFRIAVANVQERAFFVADILGSTARHRCS